MQMPNQSPAQQVSIIKGQRPPNFAKILAVFSGAGGRGVVFAYGHKIFVPSGIDLPPEIVEHELVHCDRQLSYTGPYDRAGVGPVEGWWDQYLVDPQFRFMEELLAHRAEYRHLCAARGNNRQARRSLLGHVATKLASPLYGRMVTVAEAKDAITYQPDRPSQTPGEGV